MKARHYLPTLAIAASLFPFAAQAAVIVTAQGAETGIAATPYPGGFTTVSSTDLANTGSSEFLSIVYGTDVNEVTAGAGNDGITGTSTDDNRIVLRNGVTDTVTINFNISTNTLGYDITGINTWAGWNDSGGGRANQGYSVTVTFINDTTSLISSGTYYANTAAASGENGIINQWTEVLLTDSTGILASGVKSITLDNFDDAVPGGNVQYREFDVLGVATVVPEPSSTALLGLGGLALILRRRK